MGFKFAKTPFIMYLYSFMVKEEDFRYVIWNKALSIYCNSSKTGFATLRIQINN